MSQGTETTESTASGEPKGAPETAEAATSEAAAEAPQPEVVAEEVVEPTAPAEDPELVAAREDAAKARADLEAAQGRLRAVSKAYTDLQSEMSAFKQRMEARARQDSELQAFDQVRAFFDPVMNLKRSLAATGEDVHALVDGLKIVHHQFMDALTRLGLEEVPGEGAVFDPQVHEALAVSPVADQEQDGKVLIVHTTGYTVKGKVLQAAQVVIGKYTETAGEA
ncbi:MAG: nucleotide exchange factor GrpE [Alphaproteobacteria bacterium]|nr:nucleotide exchange factor GrpE [Alphaproteobacteria bacterium]